MSPGTIRIKKKMSTATPRSVGIISTSRLTMYLITPVRPLLGEPHAAELADDLGADSVGRIARDDVEELAAAARTRLGVRAAAGRRKQHHAGETGDYEATKHCRIGVSWAYRALTRSARRCRAAGSGSGSG